METVLIVAVALLSIGFVGLVARYATDSKEINNEIDDLEKRMNDQIEKVKRRCLLQSYKPEFKYGDNVEVKPTLLGGWGQIKPERFGKVVNIEIHYSNGCIYEELTIDNGTDSFTADSSECTLMK